MLGFDVQLGRESKEKEIDEKGLKKRGGLPDQKIRQIPKEQKQERRVKLKHRKNCECCPVSLLIEK